MRKLALLIPLALAACAVGPDYHRPELETATSFDRLDTGAYGTSEPVAEFWKQFQDPLLDRLIADALVANHDLRIAAASMEAARALARQARRDLYPTATVDASYTDSRTSRSLLVTGGAPLDNELYQVNFDTFWELDLFGRVRRTNQARNADFEASAADLAGAQVSIAAELARSYFDLRGLQEQLDVAQRNATNQKDTLELTEARLNAGTGTEFDASRASAQLHATLARIPALQTAVASTIHSIAVLTGRQPQALRGDLDPPQPMPALPAQVDVGAPESLLRRRPDINAAERRLAAATARVGVAVADRFPRITIGGPWGWVAPHLDELDDGGNQNWALGPTISWPAFDFGRVRQGVKVADANTEAALASYQQTVLRALEETETGLTRYANQQREVNELGASAAASENAARLARLRFEGGVADFLQVLDAERTLLEAEDRLTTSRTATATALIAVYKALGSPFPVASP
jgi:multidrug efflux system outer membrane protein